MNSVKAAMCVHVYVLICLVRGSGRIRVRVHENKHVHACFVCVTSEAKLPFRVPSSCCDCCSTD